MTAERDGLDLAAVMAEHEGDHFCHGSGPVRKWYIPGLSPRCLPYRLAALALDLQGKVAQHHDAREYRLLNGSKPTCGACGEEWVGPRWQCDVWRAPDTCFTTQSTKRCGQCAALADPTPAARCPQQTPLEALSEPTCTRSEGHVGAHLFTSYDGKTPLEMMPK